ncbi:hypothetical protein SAMN04487948_11499 [Halogranum amylolyticum]|uniref:Uncharacterized protein n=1 Tax=Halogranum amylolyticum TaxID=660520 RepID=A0A1H8V7B2_9EURY|nr:NrpR regulatory domain-containing protein [Halogranum amylolyticum]SEP11144.1 hypothetical protein SAMN04487948_11499 [Halogranum amylolyticum]
MGNDLDRRTYDLLRLIRANEPIGSIRLVEQMQQRGYSIKGRTIRLMLSELDETGLTAKVPGKGRRLTDRGRTELDKGDISSRLKSVRERIATLTSQVTYDPAEDTGDVIACSVSLRSTDLPAVLDVLSVLSSSALGPVVAAPTVDDGEVTLRIPSSITLDGVLLSRGIDVELVTAGLVEYQPPADAESDGTVVRYIDTLSGEGSTMDVVSLLVEAGQTDVSAALDGEMGVLIVDNRTFPLTRFAEGEDLAVETTRQLGGVLDIRRPREDGPFPQGSPGWDFASLTYGGVGELAIAVLAERDLLTDWKTLVGPMAAHELQPLPGVRARLADEGLDV